jgi:LmbE family N-acetylglucosaminyl deacetylase
MDHEPVHLLVISPHPADPEFGIGGTAANWTRQGKTVVQVICTNGDKGSSDPALMPEVLARTRRQEQLAAAELLGVKEVVFLDHPDQGLEDEPSFRKEVLRLILTYRPAVVATCDPYNPLYISNRDHRVCGRVVLDAVWPAAQAPNTYRDLLSQGLSLHRVKEILLWGAGSPNVRYDITETYELKMKASRIHQSQIGPQGNPDFDARLVESAQTVGKAEGYRYAEAFHRMDVLQRL